MGIGHDSIVDPWYPLGSGNLLEAASMLVHVSHMTRPDQIERVFRVLVHENHLGFGGAPRIEEGQEASFLVHSVQDAQAAIRLRLDQDGCLGKERFCRKCSPRALVIEHCELGLFLGGIDKFLGDHLSQIFATVFQLVLSQYFLKSSDCPKGGLSAHGCPAFEAGLGKVCSGWSRVAMAVGGPHNEAHFSEVLCLFRRSFSLDHVSGSGDQSGVLERFETTEGL